MRVCWIQPRNAFKMLPGFGYFVLIFENDSKTIMSVDVVTIFFQNAFEYADGTEEIWIFRGRNFRVGIIQQADAKIDFPRRPFRSHFDQFSESLDGFRIIEFLHQAHAAVVEAHGGDHIGGFFLASAEEPPGGKSGADY